MNKQEIKKLLNKDIMDIIKLGNRTFKQYVKDGFDLCSITNAKSGACKEDCKFCAQSAHNRADIEQYPLRSLEDILKDAREAVKNKAKRFGIVTSGRSLTDKEIKKIAQAISNIKDELKIEPCASLGELTEAQFEVLKEAGLKRYHHNIETSPSFYSRIVTTHTFEDRIKTITLAKKLGMEVCCGGIIGLGESMDDRIDMAFKLKELDVDSVPLNILVPIKGTPMEGRERLKVSEIIKTIAVFRIILKDKTIKIAAGRESMLKDFQVLAFLAGANGMLIGGYLTIKGRSVEDDLKMAEGLQELLGPDS